MGFPGGSPCLQVKFSSALAKSRKISFFGVDLQLVTLPFVCLKVPFDKCGNRVETKTRSTSRCSEFKKNIAQMHCNLQSNCLEAENRRDLRALRDFGAKVCPPCHVHHTGFSAPGTIWSRLDEQVSTLDQEALVN